MSRRAPIQVAEGFRVVEEPFSGGLYVSRIEESKPPYTLVALGHGNGPSAARRALSADLAKRGLIQKVLDNR